MIERVYERAKESKYARAVVVATDDERIASVVKSFGGEYIMTADTHATGTDRLFEVVNARKDMDIIANVQGDEPLIGAESIDAAIEPLLSDPKVELSTIAYPLKDRESILDPQIVKVVLDANGFALYFSRYPIPYYRDFDDSKTGAETPRLGHAGLYVYRRETLARLASLEQTALEKTEKLEQLRALENGIKIKVIVKEHNSPGVDVPADVAKIEALIKSTTVNSYM